MVDFNKPVNTDDVANVLGLLRDAIAKALTRDYTADTNIPTGTLQVDSANGKFQRYNGSSFADWQLKAAAIEDGAVTEGKIGTGAVTEGKIGSNAVRSAKILLNSTLPMRNQADSATFNVISRDTNNTVYIRSGGNVPVILVPNDDDSQAVRFWPTYVSFSGVTFKNGGISNITFTAVAAASTPTALSAPCNRVSGADGTKGVRLPSAAEGLRCQVFNYSTTNVLRVYPFSGDRISTNAIDAYIELAAARVNEFIAMDSGTWAYKS